MSTWTWTATRSKEVELIGDKLLDLILFEEWIKRGGNYRIASPKVAYYTNNRYLAMIAEEIGLPPENTSTKKFKCMANAYEVKVAKIYLELGLEASRKFVLDTIKFNPPLMQDGIIRGRE